MSFSSVRSHRLGSLAYVAAAVAGFMLFGASAIAADADHGHDAHGAHGHVEIGHAPPAGVSKAKFESPAWFQTDLALWSFAVFMLLLALLGKFAWKPIMDGLQTREDGIAHQIAETKAANAEAKRMLATYERRLAEASEEVRSMLEEARRDADSTKQTIVAEARKAAEEAAEQETYRGAPPAHADDVMMVVKDRMADNNVLQVITVLSAAHLHAMRRRQPVGDRPRKVLQADHMPKAARVAPVE